MTKKIEKEDIDFEISFYNGLIQKEPDFVQAYIALGELYTQRGMYAQGLAVDEKLVQLKPEDPFVLYNLGCSYSLLGHIDKAYRSVKKAIKYGYRNFDFLEQDKDLSNLHKDIRFQQFLKRAKTKNAAGDPDSRGAQ